MRSHGLRAAALFLLLLAVGCNRGNRAQTDAVPEDNETRLGEAVDIDLSAWLKLPRKDLAKLHDEWSETVRAQLEAAVKAPDTVELLPRLQPQLASPAFQDAKYSPEHDLTLPNYATPGAADAGLAVHLARFGDHEAAARLLGPKDDAAKARVAALKGERNYPVEWARLVALVLYSSQLKVATGDVGGATHLAVLHQQLAKLLDDKAKAGPLGAALLPAGRRALQQAAAAWRDPKRNKVALAGDIEQALEGWGKPAEAATPLGQPREELAGALGAAAGPAVVLHQPAALARALDVLALPLPRDGARAVAAFFDGKGKLSELLVAYRAKIDTLYPTPGHLAFHLDEGGASPTVETKSSSLTRQTWAAGPASFEVIRGDRSNSLGGLVRLSAAKQPDAAGARSPRQVGQLSLDGGFEEARAALAPEQGGAMVSAKGAAAAEAVKGLGVPPPAEALLSRAKDQDVVSAVRLVWPAEQGARSLEGLLPALWAAYGSARPEGVEAADGAYLAWTWKGEHARAQLRLPFNDGPPLLVVEDTRGEAALPARAEAARKSDAAARQARLRAGEPRVRLARSVGAVNDFSLAGLSLGQGREEAVAALPRGKSYRTKDLGESVGVTVLSSPPKGATYWARQVFVRFNAAHKVSEVRVRYHEWQVSGKKAPPLAARLADAKAGAPQVLPGPWAGVWADLPRSGGLVVNHRWQDDLTVRVFQRDPWGAELILRDRGADGGEPPPFRHLGDGVAGAALGATRAEVQAALKSPVKVDGAVEVYRQPAGGAYEAVFVWFAKDRVSRVLALHRGAVEAPDAARALQAAWGKNLGQLGYVRRQEPATGSELGAMYWFDDRVRVKTYVHQGDAGARLYTEWREWPIGK